MCFIRVKLVERRRTKTIHQATRAAEFRRTGNKQNGTTLNLQPIFRANSGTTRTPCVYPHIILYFIIFIHPGHPSSTTFVSRTFNINLSAAACSVCSTN